MEIEKIKQLLMTPHQRILFDYEPKPVISIYKVPKSKHQKHGHHHMKVQDMQKV